MLGKPFATLCLGALLAVGLIGCGKSESDEATKSPAGDPVKAAPVDRPAVTDPVDTTYISSNFVVAVVAHPARIYNSKTVQDSLKSLETVLGKAEIDKAIAEMKTKIGFDPRTLEQTVFLVDSNALQQFNPAGRQRRFRGGRSERKSSYAPQRTEKTKAFPDDSKTPDRGPFKTEAKTRAFPDEKKIDPDGCTVTAEAQPGGFPFGGAKEEEFEKSMPAGILRFSKPVDQAAFLTAFSEQGRDFRTGTTKTVPPEKEERDGLTIYTIPFGPAFTFVDGGKTILIGNPANLSRMSAAKNVDSPLTRRLKSLSRNHDVLAAVAGQPVQQLLLDIRKEVPLDEIPEEYRAVPDLLVRSKSLAMTFSITSDPMLSVILETGDAESATALVDVINKTALPQLKMLYGLLKKQAAKEPAAAGFQKLADELFAGLKVKSDKTDLVVSLDRPASYGEIPKLLLPAVQQAREAARRSSRKNNLKQVGLAMHNFHDTFGNFPAHDSMGSRGNDKQKSGLSWRVHLLPFIESSPLYSEFKLDEPWDSPHNKKLISRMPAVFGSPNAPELQKEGKTMLHVFVDPKNPTTPFSMKDEKGVFRGVRFSDIKDGTSNTILVVEAGRDKADIWTKPGGLPFDPKKNPIELLGKLDGEIFLALLCDGSVHAISKHTLVKTLKLLIQHNDGMPVGEY